MVVRLELSCIIFLVSCGHFSDGRCYGPTLSYPGTKECQLLSLPGDVISRHQLKFLAKGEKDVVIGLAADAGQSNGYTRMVYIGGYGNEKTTIYDFDSCADFSSSIEISEQVSDPNTLSSTESRPFWITWDNQNVAVGRGDTVEEEVIASHVYDVSLPIGAIFVAGVEGKSFELNFEDETYCPTSTVVNPTSPNPEPASFAATNSVSTETGIQLGSSNNKLSVESTNADDSSTSQNTVSRTSSVENSSEATSTEIKSESTYTNTGVSSTSQNTVSRTSSVENSSEATSTEIKSESTYTNTGSKLDDAETSFSSPNTDSSVSAQGLTTLEKGNDLTTGPVQELSIDLSSTIDFQSTLTVLDNTYPPISSTTSSVDNASPSSPQYTSSGLSDETLPDSRHDASTSLLESTILQSGNGANTIAAAQGDTSQEPHDSPSLDPQDNTSVGWPDNTSQVSQEYTSVMSQGSLSVTSPDKTSKIPKHNTSTDTQNVASGSSQDSTSEVPQGNTSTDDQNIAHGTSSDNTSPVSRDYKSTDSQNSATATVSNSPSQANGHSSTFSSPQNASPGLHENTPAVSSTGFHENTPAVSSTGFHENTPAVSSTGFHENTPAVSSTGFHENTPAVSSTGFHENTPAVSSEIYPASSSTDTAIPPFPPKHQQRCCHCIKTPRKNSTQEKEFADASEAVVNDLKVPRHNVSARIREKTCAKDDRISSKALGYLGAFLCAVPMLLIVAGDVMRCFRGFCDKDDDVNIP